MVGFFGHCLPIEPIFLALGQSGKLVLLLPHCLSDFPDRLWLLLEALLVFPNSPDAFMAVGKVSIFVTRKIKK